MQPPQPVTKSTRLFCFSPPVMIATFAIEIILASYTIWRYKMTPVSRLIVALLVFLALFQLSEYFVCGGMGLSAERWSRVGFASISMLPPIGLHLMHVLAGKKNHWLVGTAYGTAALCIAYFLSWPNAFVGNACLGNYVIFQIGALATVFYATFYYGWLVAALGLGWLWQRKASGTKRGGALTALLTGYFIFLVPVAAINITFPDTIQGIPSILCGFAVLLAFVAVFFVAPRAASKR